MTRYGIHAQRHAQPPALMSHGNHSHHHHHDALDSQGTSLSPLFPHLHRGLIAVTVLAITSFVASSALFVYLTTKLLQRYVFGPKPQPADPTTASQSSSNPNSKRDDDFRLGIDGIFTDSGSSTSQGEALVKQKSVGASASSASQTIVAPNQSLILIYNLVVADIIQSSAFALNLSWLVQDGIFIQTATCFTQGLLISLGDLSSSVFITAIAAHAFFSIVRGYQPRHCVLYLVIACLWSFIFVVSLVPIAATRNGADEGGYFVRAVAWVSQLPFRPSFITLPFSLHLLTHLFFGSVGSASSTKQSASRRTTSSSSSASPRRQPSTRLYSSTCGGLLPASLPTPFCYTQSSTWCAPCPSPSGASSTWPTSGFPSSTFALPAR